MIKYATYHIYVTHHQDWIKAHYKLYNVLLVLYSCCQNYMVIKYIQLIHLHIGLWTCSTGDNIIRTGPSFSIILQYSKSKALEYKLLLNHHHSSTCESRKDEIHVNSFGIASIKALWISFSFTAITQGNGVRVQGQNIWATKM